MPTRILAQIVSALNNARGKSAMKPFITLGIGHVEDTEDQAGPMGEAQLQLTQLEGDRSEAKDSE